MFKEASLDDESDSHPDGVSVKVSELLFSDGTRIEIGKRDIVVFVGPNNAGKSAALREIEDEFSNKKGKVFQGITLLKSGTSKDVINFIKRRSRERVRGAILHYSGLGYNINSENIEYCWLNSLKDLKPLFINRLSTEARITQSNGVNSINTLEEDPNHPIHLLAADELLELKVSGYFRRAFGKDLIVFRGGGSRLPLFVGEMISPDAGEDRISTSYLKRLRDETVPLDEQGDGMRSFATIILHLLAAGEPSIQMLDEPEAFLHPPQARLIGEFIAKERAPDTQLFIATHSPDLLLGLLSAAPDTLRVIRLQRAGQVNRAKELEKSQAKAIGADPLMKYSGVVSGVFHQRVFITESDADAMFYGSILDLPSVHGNVTPDVLFVQAGGKHRMGALAGALRALDVSVDVITDVDVLNDEKTFRQLVEALGGDWAVAGSDAVPLKKAIEEHKPWLNSAEVVNGITRVLSEAPQSGEFPRNLKGKVDAIFRKASPWDAIKEAGAAAVPAGQATAHWTSLLAYCRLIGLWIVTVGELEGFCKAEGGKGPKWTQHILEKYDLANAPELGDARAFVSAVWGRL